MNLLRAVSCQLCNLLAAEVLNRARPRAKSGRKFAIGQVFLTFTIAPTGNGLSFFHTETRPIGRSNKNPNPIINPMFIPDFLPGCYSSTTNIYLFST